MTLNALPIPAKIPTPIQTDVKPYVRNISTLEASTKAFLAELAMTTANNGKRISSLSQQNVANANSTRAGVYSPASLGMPSASTGTSSTSASKCANRKRRKGKTNSLSPLSPR